ITRAPECASRTAAARPIPLVAPVTRHTAPFSCMVDPLPETRWERSKAFGGYDSAVPLDMPLAEAMETQRAIRRLKPDPVDDAVILRCIELALKAPTGSNAQNWEW